MDIMIAGQGTMKLVWLKRLTGAMLDTSVVWLMMMGCRYNVISYQWPIHLTT